MQATLTLDGVCFIIESTKDKDISFVMPSESADDVRLSPVSVQVLISVLLAAVADVEEDS